MGPSPRVLRQQLQRGGRRAAQERTLPLRAPSRRGGGSFGKPWLRFTAPDSMATRVISLIVLSFTCSAPRFFRRHSADSDTDRDACRGGCGESRWTRCHV